MGRKKKLVLDGSWQFLVIGIVFILFSIGVCAVSYSTSHRLDLFVLVFLSVFSLFGVLSIMHYFHLKADTNYMKSYGRCIRTIVDRIDVVEKSMRTNNDRVSVTEYYVVVCKDSDGNEYKSDELRSASPDLVGKYLDVYVDIDDSSKFYIDFDSVLDV